MRYYDFFNELINKRVVPRGMYYRPHGKIYDLNKNHHGVVRITLGNKDTVEIDFDSKKEIEQKDKYIMITSIFRSS